MSNQEKKKSVPDVEERKQDQELSKEQLIKEIQSNKLIPREYKALLIKNIDLPERVASLEAYVSQIVQSMDGLPDKFLEKVKEEMQKRQQSVPQGAGQQGGSGLSLMDLLNNPLVLGALGGGGQSEMDKFFFRLGQETFFNGLAWQDTFMKEQAKGMGRMFMKNWQDKAKELKDQYEVKSAEGPKGE